MSKTEELEFEIYQQIKGLTPRQQRIIYENLRKIKFNMEKCLLLEEQSAKLIVLNTMKH